MAQMIRPGERTAEEYRAEGDRVRAEAAGVQQSLLRMELIGVAVAYDGMARIAETLARVRNT
jgi:hypothetical protein